MLSAKNVKQSITVTYMKCLLVLYSQNYFNLRKTYWSERMINLCYFIILYSYLVTGVGNTYIGVFLGFSIYISSTTNTEDGVLCFRDTNFTQSTIPNSVSIKCPYNERYVIYHNNRTHPPYPNNIPIT